MYYNQRNNRIEDNGMKNQFYQFLKEMKYKEYTPSGNPSTIYSYINSIDFVCKEENMSWSELANHINEIIKTYDEGGIKCHIGNKSNRTIINGIKRFDEFLSSLTI